MKSLLIIFLLIGSYTVNAQDIKFKIIGQSDTTVNLVKYFGQKLFYADTAEMVNGVVEFDGSKQEAGILALYLPGEKILDFIYNEESSVYIEAALPNLMGTAESKPDGSKPISIENKIFLEYVQYISNKRQEAAVKSKSRDGLEENDPQYVRLSAQISTIEAEMNEYKEKIGNEFWSKEYLAEKKATSDKYIAKREKVSPEKKKHTKLSTKIQGVEDEVNAYKDKIVKEHWDDGLVNGQRMQLKQLKIQRDGHEEGSEMYKSITAEIDAINMGVVDYQKNIAQNPNNLFVSKIVLMSMDIEIPETPLDADGNIIDSNFRFKYYRDHYFDNIDLKDDRLMRNRVFHNKFTNYFSSNLMLQHWDTVIHYAFQFCDALDPKSDMFQYTVSWITSQYEKSKIMGMNKVFIYMGERYYCTLNEEGKSPAHWMPKKNLDALCEKVSTHYDLVMGAKPPNLILRDTTDVNWRDFYSLDNEYTVLYFWDPECGHCKKITPKLQNLYSKKWKDRNIDIFAVGKATGDDFNKWKEFVRKNKLEFINVAVTANLYDSALVNASQFIPRYTTLKSLNYQKTYDIYATPKVWVLDKDKKIVAYSLTVSQLENLMDRLQKKTDAPKLYPLEEEDPEEDMMH
ncbi:MAG: thiol-disulfide isomerase/thioredoxin [Crocinitomicaceae bacterium]|jgi:thiol-disulfide isomerase/thioredoxin